MERGFDVRSGSIAIGDPTMGLVTLDLKLAPGKYDCERGALQNPREDDGQQISLNDPCLFVMDAEIVERFLDWYRRTFNECGFVIPRVAMQLDRAEHELGIEVGFYWEETLSGRSQEGTYSLDLQKIVLTRKKKSGNS